MLVLPTSQRTKHTLLLFFSFLLHHLSLPLESSSTVLLNSWTSFLHLFFSWATFQFIVWNKFVIVLSSTQNFGWPHRSSAFRYFWWIWDQKLCLILRKSIELFFIRVFFLVEFLETFYLLLDFWEFVHSSGSDENSLCSSIESVLDDLNDLFEGVSFGAMWSFEALNNEFGIILSVLLFGCSKWSTSSHRK